jgi:hypothetical protein
MEPTVLTAHLDEWLSGTADPAPDPATLPLVRNYDEFDALRREWNREWQRAMVRRAKRRAAERARQSAVPASHEDDAA